MSTEQRKQNKTKRKHNDNGCGEIIFLAVLQRSTPENEWPFQSRSVLQ